MLRDVPELDARSWATGSFRVNTRAMNALPMPMLRAPCVPSAFASAAVTSIGMFGRPIGFAPRSWMYEVPLLVLVGTITERPLVIDGRIEARPVLPVTATIEHRYVDGWHIARAMKSLRAISIRPRLSNPTSEIDRLVSQARPLLV